MAKRHNFVECSTIERKWAFSPNFRYFAAVGRGCQVFLEGVPLEGGDVQQ